jgi:flagellar hook-associated protein 3 FlgL
MRLGTANTYDKTLDNLNARQAAMSSLQEKLSLGKQVVHPSDDPSAAAQAERAMTRIDRIKSDQKALAVQKEALANTESTLGSAVSLMQTARELIVSAGNAGYGPSEHNSIAQQLAGIRDQLVDLANQKDANGQPLFGGLGSASSPFVSTATGVQFNGLNGQLAPTQDTVPYTMDGSAVWMNVPTGNGVFSVATGATNSGTAYSDAGVVINPSAITGDTYALNFTVAAGVTTYNVTDTTSGAAVVTAQPYKAGQSIAFDGMSLTVRGAPRSGDSLQISPSTRTDLFSVLDSAIQNIRGAAANSPVMMQSVQQSLVQVDSASDRLQAARGLAGDWLNRADAISASQDSRSAQMTSDRSRAEDLDMVKGISDFQTQQTAYDAALKSYAQVQKLSLFNYIN